MAAISIRISTEEFDHVQEEHDQGQGPQEREGRALPADQEGRQEALLGRRQGGRHGTRADDTKK